MSRRYFLKLYLSKEHSDVEGPLAQEGKLAIIRASKDEIIALAEFFSEVSEKIKTDKLCHMQFRDYLQNWERGEHIDIQIDVE